VCCLFLASSFLSYFVIPTPATSLISPPACYEERGVEGPEGPPERGCNPPLHPVDLVLGERSGSLSELCSADVKKDVCVDASSSSVCDESTDED